MNAMLPSSAEAARFLRGVCGRTEGGRAANEGGKAPESAAPQPCVAAESRSPSSSLLLSPSEDSASGSTFPLVAVHGFAQDGGTWDDLEAALHRRGWSGEFIRFEYCQGQGEEPCGFDAVCEALARCIRSAPGCPLVIGYSMGGRVLLETLLRYGDLPLGAVLVESAGLGPDDGVQACALAERNGRWIERLRSEGVDGFMDWWEMLPLFESQRSLPPARRERLRAERTGRSARALEAALDGLGPARQHPKDCAMALLSDLAASAVSVLYVAGSLDGKYAAVAAEVPCPAAIVEGAGHSVHFEKPEVFAEMVLGLADAADLH